MRVNPEIQRNVWLQFSVHRLLMMPLAVGLIFFVVYQMATNDPYKALVSTAEALFALIVNVWGGYCAANSVIDEINDRTWDFQRLSALSAWQMTVGKLFGSTLYAWYGGIIPLGVLMYVLPQTLYAGNPIITIAGLILGGLSIQSMALFTSLLLSRLEGARQRKLRPVLYLVFGLVLGNGLTSQLFLTQSMLGAQLPPTVWYGQAYDFALFHLALAILTLVWTIAGIYWQMRGQMKMKTGPWLWTFFVVFWGVFAFGYQPPHASTFSLRFQLLPFTRPDLMAFMLVIGNLYLVSFVEQWNGVRYRRIVEAWKRRDYAKCHEICPRWIPTFLVCIGFAVIPSIILGQDAFSLLVFLPFALRDIALLHFVRLSPDSRRPIAMTIFYLFMLYVMLPLVLIACKQKVAVVDFEPWLILSINPDRLGQAPSLVLISGLLQAAVVSGLAFYRWHRYWLALPKSPEIATGQVI